jgi:hypothetical protein
VIHATDGWKLIDWDTALVAPPERDLWLLGSDAVDRYESITGRTTRAALLELDRLWHDLADIAIAVDTFARPHTDDADATTAFNSLRALVAG